MAVGNNGGLDADAYRKLYPDEFLSGCLAEGLRPDSRPLGRARATTFGFGAVPSADGSALVKVGNTAMLAGVKLEVMTPTDDARDRGKLVVDFQMPPVCSPEVRPGRPTDAIHAVLQQVTNAVTSAGLVDTRELCILEGQAAWAAYLDIYCLDADGSLLDAALLACVAALVDLKLPAVFLTAEGRVMPPKEGLERETADQQETAEPLGPAPDGSAAADGAAIEGGLTRTARRLTLGSVPVALTCGLYKEHLLADPTAEEEALLGSQLSVVLDKEGRLVSLYKPGGIVAGTPGLLQDCIALAQLRYKEVIALLESAVEEAGVEKGDIPMADADADAAS